MHLLQIQNSIMLLFGFERTNVVCYLLDRDLVRYISQTIKQSLPNGAQIFYFGWSRKQETYSAYATNDKSRRLLAIAMGLQLIM